MEDAEKLVSREEIEAAVKGHNADYVEVRIDDASTNRLVYRGKELEEIGRTRSFGGCGHDSTRRSFSPRPPHGRSGCRCSNPLCTRDAG